MRESTEWTLDAEKYASLAWLDGDTYPASDLTEAWKKVTFNDFHDLAAGSGIGVIYKDAQSDYDQVRATTDEISAHSLQTLAARIDTRAADGIPVLVFNSLGWQRFGMIDLSVQMPAPARDVSVVNGAGQVLPSEVISGDPKTNTFHLLAEVSDVPSIGYEVLRVVPRKLPFESDLRVSGTTLENAALRVVVDKETGCITSLYDKKSHQETLAAGACGNELQLFKDTPKDYDAWNIDPGTLDQPPSLISKADSVEVVGSFPDQSVRVTRHWQNSKFVQTIGLGSWDSDQVDIDNEIDWHEKHVLLKAAFPLAASGPFATYEIPYGTIDRPTTRSNSWEQAQFEVPAMRWADLGDGKHGLSVINNSKYGYDAVGNVLRLTLLRSPKWPDADADMGHHHFHYALYPHAGTWKDALTVRHGYEYNYPLTAVVTTAHSGSLPASHSFASVTPENVVLTAVKKAEDANGLIFRVYEWAGKESTVEFHVPPGATGATVTNLMEVPEGDPLAVSGDTVKAPIK